MSCIDEIGGRPHECDSDLFHRGRTSAEGIHKESRKHEGTTAIAASVRREGEGQVCDEKMCTGEVKRAIDDRIESAVTQNSVLVIFAGRHNKTKK